MLNDLTKEIKAQLYERVRSPLFGTFAFAWAAWNYRSLLAVVSGMTFQEKLAYLDAIYPSWWHWATYCLAGPLTTAVLLLLTYPYPARWIYQYWANQQKELKKVQQRIEDETPLTQEEAKALRKASLVQIAEMEAQVIELRQHNKELSERLREAANENQRLAEERDGFQQAAKKAQEELAPHMASVLHPEINASNVLTLSADPEEVPRVSQDVVGSVTTEEQEDKPTGARAGILNAIMRLGEGTTEELADVARAEVSETKRELLGLVGDGLVIRQDNMWKLTQRAKLAVPMHNLW